MRMGLITKGFTNDVIQERLVYVYSYLERTYLKPGNMLRPKSLWWCSLWHGKGEVDLIEDVPKSDQHQAVNIRYSLLKGNLSESATTNELSVCLWLR